MVHDKVHEVVGRIRFDDECAVQRHGLSAGAIPVRQMSLQPVAIGEAVEVTKQSMPSVQRVASGDPASTQAVTRVNAEQAPKESDAEADPPRPRGRPPSLG